MTHLFACCVVGSSPRVRGTAIPDARWFFADRFIPACARNRIRSAKPYRMKSVHPRVCGEQKCDSEIGDAANGSSPRVRGTDLKKRFAILIRRFIPACAGNRWRKLNSHTIPPVHPRVCGEQIELDIHRILVCGSSPRVRGTVARPLGSRSCNRFIPACAGCGATLLVNMRDIEPRKEDDGFDGASLSP